MKCNLDKNKFIRELNVGVIYIVTGEMNYLKECIFSAKSLKKFCPEIPITLFTDHRTVIENCFDEVRVIDDIINPYKVKVKYILESPYEYSLFLDSDTQVCAPIYELFELLKENDLALAALPKINRLTWPAKLLSYESYVNEFPEYNTGVILYKKSPSTMAFLGKWLDTVLHENSELTGFGLGDQNFFNHLIQEKYQEECGAILSKFSNKIYNVRPPMISPLIASGEMKKVKILHCHNLHRNFLTRQVIRVFTKLQRDPNYIKLMKVFDS